MPVATSLAHDICLVVATQPFAGGLRIQFGDDSTAVLDATHPNFAVYRVTVESRCGQPMPIGVVLDAQGHVVDLNAAHDTCIRFFRKDADVPSRFQVGCWGYSPICYLVCDHPEFERIRSLLAAVAGTDRRVQIANHSELVVTEPQGNQEGETWWKIMDVRPV